MDYGFKLLFVFIILTSTASAADLGQLASDTIFNFSSISVNITVLALQNFSQLQYPASPTNTLEFTINSSTIQFNATTAKTIYNITRNIDVVNWSYTGVGNLIVNATVQYLSANYSLYKEGVLQYTNLSSSTGTLIYTLSSAGNYSIQRVSGVPALITPTNQSSQSISTLPYSQSFTWSNENSNQYEIQIATDSAFANLESDLKVTSNSTSIGLWIIGTHYWRVRNFDGISTYGNWSNPFNFQLTQTSSPSSDGSTGIQGIVYEQRTGVGNVVLSGAIIQIYNLTWSSSTTSDISGYYRFTGLANNTLYSIKATKQNYNDGSVELVTTANGTWFIKNLYLTACVSSFTCNVNQLFVTFRVQNIIFQKYANLAVSVYKGSDTTTIYTGITNPDGTINFWLIKDQQYTITFINASQGISTSWTGYPPLSGYQLISIPLFTSGMYTYGSDKSKNINISISTNSTDPTTAYINITYNDSLAQTSNLNFYLNQSILGDPNNQTNIQTISASSNSSYNASFAITNYASQSYIVTVSASHTTYSTILQSYGVQFPSLSTPLSNFNPTVILMLSMGLIFFIAGMFGQTSTTQGAGIIVAICWLLSGIAIFTSSNVGTGFYLALTLATIVTIILNINERTRKEGIA